MKARLSQEAQRELEQVVAYYDECAPGLGDRFIEEFVSAVQRLEAFPEAWTSMSPNVRRIVLNRFPYCLVYGLDDGRILILAVMHMRRKPRQWD